LEEVTACTNRECHIFQEVEIGVKIDIRVTDILLISGERDYEDRGKIYYIKKSSKRIDIEISRASDGVDIFRAKQVLKLSAISIALTSVSRSSVTSKYKKVVLVVMCIEILVLIHEIADELRTRRELMMEAKAYRGHFVLIVESRSKIVVKELEPEVAKSTIPVSKFALDAGFGGEAILNKGIGNVVLEKSIFTKPVRLIMVLTKAEGKLVINAGDDNFVTHRGMFSPDATQLQSDTIPIEQRVEFIE